MDKSVLITGAGSGIGEATAIKFSQDSKVILCGRRVEELERVKKKLSNTFDHMVCPLDVTKKEDLNRLSVLLQNENLHSVIANHGVAGANFWGEEDRFDLVMKVNLTGTYNLVGACIDALKKSTHSYKHIMVTSSVLAKMGVAGFSAYCASKAGLLGLVRSWAMEFAADKILVNAVCPGWVATDMAKEGIESFASSIGVDFDQALKMQMSEVPLGKMSDTDELADLFYFLASPSNRSITGQSHDINNGALLS